MAESESDGNLPLALENLLHDLENPKDPSKSPRIAIFGGREVGKSKMYSLLTKALLKGIKSDETQNYILHIELSLAQPDFCPPGVISLSKIDSNGNSTLLSKYLGSLDPFDCYRVYKRSVQEFLEFITTNKMLTVPWILHTMQIFIGVGIEIAHLTLKLMEPSIIIQSDEPILRELRLSETNCRLLTIEAKEPIFKRIYLDKATGRKENQKNKRDVKLREYFDCSDDYSEKRKLCEKVISLTACGIGSFKENVGYAELLHSLTGNLVALCRFHQRAFKIVQHDHKPFHSSPAESQDNWRQKSTINSHPITSHMRKMVAKPEQFSNEFVGYGIVQSLNYETFQITLITPVSQSDIDSQVNCIIAAEGVKLCQKTRWEILGLLPVSKNPSPDSQPSSSSSLRVKKVDDQPNDPVDQVTKLMTDVNISPAKVSSSTVNAVEPIEDDTDIIGEPIYRRFRPPS